MTKGIQRCNIYTYVAFILLHHLVILINGTEHCASIPECRCYTKVRQGTVADCSNLNLTSVPYFTHDVISVNLSFNLLQRFSGKGNSLGRVLTLDLSNNNLSLFTNQSFEKLMRLKTLYLQNNHLRLNNETFPLKVFKDVSNLKILNLKNNIGKNLTGQYYPDKAFSKLKSLSVLEIDGLGDNPFGSGFASLPYLREVNISGNTGKCLVPILTTKYFMYMRNLKLVDVSHCKILRIEKGAFQNLAALTYLDISHNEDLTFRVCENVTHDLQNTSIKTFKLNKIHKTFGVGTKLFKQDMKYLINTSIEEIHLDSNRLEIVEDGVFLFLPRTTKYLSAEDNKFTMGRYVFQIGFLKGFKVFNGRNQFKSHDPIDLLKQPNSGSCDLQNRHPCDPYPVSSSPYQLKLEKETDDLVIHVSHETRLRSDIIIPLPSHLETVYFSLCKLQYQIPKLQFAGNRIKYLDFSGNVLHSWKGPVKNLKMLKYLDLSNNYCSYVSTKFFEDIGTLITLILRDNLLAMSLADDANGIIFSHLKKLKHLDLSINRISLLQKYTFRGLIKLEIINLSRNLLQELPIDLGHMTNLWLIDISDNLLSELPNNVRHVLDQLSARTNVSVNMLGNNFVCSCDKLDFLKWLLNTKVNFKYLQKYQCTTRNGTKLKFDDLDNIVSKLDLECSTMVGLIFGVLTAIIVFVSIVIGGLVYRYRWKIRYLYYTTKNRYLGYGPISDHEADDEYIYDAFISYADEDREFVRKDMCKYLEEDGGCKLCIHHRDFLPGMEIAANVTNAIHSSRKCIFLLSKSFLRSYWCNFEFNMARMESIYSRDGQNVVFLVFYGDISPSDLSLIMMELVESRSYIEYPNDPQGNVVFWAKVKEAISKRGSSIT